MSHALLSPSSAHKWMVCTPSAKFEARYPDKESVYEAEGTKAHALCARLLILASRAMTLYAAEKIIDYWLSKLDESFDEEMKEAARGYAMFVLTDYFERKEKVGEARLEVEVLLDLGEFIPEGFGTSDAVIISGNTLHVIDFKYGKGVRVEAENNPQMLIYAVGAYSFYNAIYDVDEVLTSIYQPRINNISTASMTGAELMAFAENLKGIAEKASKGKGEFVPGDHCRFCRARQHCKALAGWAEELRSNLDANELQPHDIQMILLRSDAIKSWLSAVEDYALESAMAGNAIPGFKIVEGRSVRKYSDENKVAEVLESNGFMDIWKKSLKTITEMEKMITKKTFATLLSGLIIKPSGKPTLVPENDLRPDFNSAETDFKDI